MKTIDSDIDAVDKAIVAGDLGKAHVLLKKILKTKAPREARARLAQVARRAGLSDVSLRLLNPIVRLEGRKIAEEATDMEKAEYATALRNEGAVEEAVALLETIQETSHPEALFLLALAYFSRWDYLHAIPILRKYVLMDLPPYQRLVGEVNLASALIHEKLLPEGREMLRRIEKEARAGGHSYLLGKALYFGAELEVLDENPTGALACLRASQEFLRGASPLDQLLVRMWEAISHHQKERSLRSRAVLDEVRGEAIQQGAWELARNCDLHRAWFDRDARLFEYVYFGTPSETFRKRMHLLWPEGIPHAKKYEWTLVPGDSPRTFSREDQAKVLKVGSVLHRLFTALESDFYRPLRVAELHDRIYPGEFFDPTSSPYKVRQAIKLLRARFRTRKMPVSIEEQKFTYRLSASEPFVISVGENSLSRRSDEVIHKIHEAFKDTFSATDAVKCTGVSRRTVLRALEVAVEEGALVRTGSSKATRYRFKTH